MLVVLLVLLVVVGNEVVVLGDGVEVLVVKAKVVVDGTENMVLYCLKTKNDEKRWR